MPWTDEDELEFSDHGPLPAGAQVLPEQRIVGRNPDADLEENDWLGDLLTSATPLVAPPLADMDRSADAASRVGRRASRFLSSAAEDPGAALAGAAQGASLGWADELMGLAQANPAAELGRSLSTGDSFDPISRYREGRDTARSYTADAADRSPYAYGGGEAIGSVAPLLIPGGAAEEGAGILASTARGAMEGGLYGGAAALGESEATDVPELLGDAGEGVAAGGLVGGSLGAVGGIASRARRAAPRLQREADRARISSVLGERRAPISDTEMQRLISTLGRGERDPVAGAARRIREGGFVGPFSTVEDVAERAQAAADREGARLGEIRATADASPQGGRIRVDAVPDALQRYAQALSRGESTEPFAGAVTDTAERWRRIGMAQAPELAALRDAEAELARIHREPPPQIPRVEEMDSRPDDFVNDITGRFGAEEMAAIRARAATPPLGETAASPRRVRPRRPAEENPSTPERAPDPPQTPPPTFRSPETPEDIVAARLADARRMSSATQHVLELRAQPPTRARADLERALSQLDTTVPWTNPQGSPVRLPVDVARGQRRTIRDALDREIAPMLPPEVAADFAPARRRWQAADTVSGMAERRASRAQMRSPLASALPAAQAVLQGGSGAVAALAGGGIYRAARAREAAALATGLEMVSGLLQRTPERLGPFADVLRNAATRGALPVVHQLLMRRDPAYAAMVEQAIPSEDVPMASEDDFAPADDVPMATEDDFLPLEETP